MRRPLALLPLLLAAGAALPAEPAPMPQPAGPVTFEQVVAAARDDAAALPPGEAALTRYLSAAHAADPDGREKLYAVTCYQVNSLSREADLVKPRKVTPWLWAVRLDDYGWRAATWEDLRRANSYFCIKVQVPGVQAKTVKKTLTDRVKKTRPVQGYDQYGRPYTGTQEYYEEATREVVETVEAAAARADFLPAPWLPAAQIADLVKLTGSVTPVVAADQFFDRTALQRDREGHGYYDFLGLDGTRTVKDLDELIGFDRKKAQKARREAAAIVIRSGVAKFPRQAFRESATTGGRWETRDTDSPAGDGNALDRLFEDFKFKASEIIAVLPNGLPVTYLANEKGERQDAAPVNIVGNHKSLDNDLEIGAGTWTCLHCHAGALVKIRDYGRAAYSDATGLRLAVVDPAKERRARYAYLTDDFAFEYEGDQARFDRKYQAATGLPTKELVAAVAGQWRTYRVDAVTLKRAAARAGVTADALRAALRAHVATKRKAGVPADAVLANLLLDDEDAQPIPVDLFEERFGVLMLILGGANP